MKGGGFKHNSGETEKLGTHFQTHGEKLNSAGGTHLGSARESLGRTRGKGALANAAENGAQKLVDSLTKGQQALGKHLGDVGTGLKQTSANHAAHEEELTKKLGGITAKGAEPKAPAWGGGKSFADVLKGKDSSSSTPKPPNLRNEAGKSGGTSTPLTAKTTKGDPVDVASGDVIIPQTDVTLPSILPLVLSRTHISSYRCGGWFGPSWASTLDQRLELDEQGAVFAAEDGTLLVYPVPEAGEHILPEAGPAWPLYWDGTAGGGMSVTDPYSGTTWSFGLPGEGAGPHARRAGAMQLPLRSVGDRNGNRIELQCGPGGAPVEVRHTGGYRVGVDTQGDRITGLRLLSGEGDPVELVGFGYDGHGNLATVTDSSGLPMSFTYDNAARITGWTNRLSQRYRYVYDRAGRCVQARGDGGYLDTVFAYDPANRTTTVTDSLGHRTLFELDEQGRTVRETSPLGAVAASEWSERGQLLSQTDPLGHTTRFEYDADGNLALTTLPDGTTSAAVHNEQHQITELTALDGASWTYAYDAAGNLVRRTDPLGAQTAYTYGELGHPAAVTDALGHTARVTTNPAGLPIAATDPLGAESTWVRDRFGRPASITDPLGRVTRYGWTVEGRPVWQVDPDGSRQEWRHDAEGNLIEHQDATGAVTRFEYTYFGRLAARTEPDGARYTFAYDTQLQLTEVTNPEGAHWSYQYNPVGELTSETDFTGRTTHYTRDLAGRLTSTGSLDYVRDANGRTVEIRSAAGAIRYTYDPAGRVLAMADGLSQLRYRYDALGRVLAEECGGATVSHEYDALGQRILRRTPSGVESRWAYDAAGRPLSLTGTEGALTFQHDVLGRETTRAFGAVAVNHAWGALDQLTALSVMADGTPLRERAFDYRADRALIAGSGKRYELDVRGRVTAVTGPEVQERYGYGPAGELISAQAGDESTDGERTLEDGLLRRAGRTRYDYDDHGRLVARHCEDGTTYEWDQHDQLTAVHLPDSTVWHYAYDPAGRRIAKRRLDGDGVTVLAETRFTWDGAALVEQTHTENGETRTTTWDRAADGTPIAQTTDSRFFAIVTDLVGAPTELVDGQGEFAWQFNATLWGAPLSSEGAVDCALRFPGQYHDAETGLHYNVFRYYDPATARYLSPDPLRLAGGPDPYGYVRNPNGWVDPLGLEGRMLDLYHGTTAAGANSIMRDGVNPQFRPRPMDFGHGGFYVTNDLNQAQRWAARQGARPRTGGPAVLHFQVPESSLDQLNGRRFGPGQDAELGAFIRHHRDDLNGTAMHSYDLVEGKMWMNSTQPHEPMVLRGHQIAVFTPAGVQALGRPRRMP